MKRLLTKEFLLPLFICLFFLTAYVLLAVIKHVHFLSGYDLAIADQVLWKYAYFKNPITTVQSFAGTPLLSDHVEIIYLLLAPFYWIYNSVITFIVLQVAAVIAGGVAVYVLARKKGLSLFVSLALLISFFCFYGIQQAIWSDVHSLVFAVGFLAWFIYFFDQGKWKLTFLFFLLSLCCKEDIALLTCIISGIFLITKRQKQAWIFIVLSIFYLFSIFYLYFPHFTRDGYRYQSPHGLLYDINPLYFFDTTEKQQVILYSLGSFGFLPLFAPVYLLLAVADLAHYFVLGHAVVTSAQGLFMHYRSSLALFLAWPTIVVISRLKKYQTWLALYLLVCTFFFQYFLHSPLSYLSKSWFWKTPTSISDINFVISKIPPDAKVVSQNNISPHLTHREYVVTLWPEKKDFKENSPCGQKTCDWFRWYDHPNYLIVDTSKDWDIRHFLAVREDFVKGISNMQTARIITPVFTSNNATLYKIVQQP